MYKNILLAGLMCLSVGATARDQGPQNFYFGGEVGKLWTDDNRELSDAYMAGANLGWRFHQNFAVEGGYSHLNDISVTNRRDADGDMVRFDVVGYLGPYGDFLPFVSVGGGRFDFDDPADQNDQSFFSLGVGTRYWLTKGVDMTWSARYYRSSDESLDDLSMQVGIAYHFGGSEPAKPAALTVVSLDELDSDGDGVPDVRDDCLNTPVGFKVGPDGCAQSFDDVESVDLDVKFKFDSAELAGDSRAALDEVAGFLKRHPKASVRVQGHTDSMGTDEYNLKLSVRRANAAKKYLTSKHKISAQRVSVEGFGEFQPIATNATETGRRMNRRVESNIRVIVRKPIQRQ